jgi:E3 ubiquitin-protein ligase HUWE1
MHLNEDRLFQIAQGWNTRDHELNMVSLTRDDTVIPRDLEEVSFQFYRQAKPDETAQGKGKEVKSTTTTPFQTPAKPRSKDKAKETPSTSLQAGGEVSEGLVNVDLGNVCEEGKSATDILADAVEEYGIPEDDRLALLHKIRVAQAMRDPDARRRMLLLRLLTIAILG